MNFYTEYLWFNTQKKREFINITHEVESALRKSGIKEGFALVSAMHITAGVYVNDAESGLIQDIEDWLQEVAPEGPDYQHHRTGEVNGDAHLKSLRQYQKISILSPVQFLRDVLGEDSENAE